MKSVKTVTIDASVFVSALLNETNSKYSIKLLDLIEKNNLQVICPSIVVVEIVSAVFRNTNNKALKTLAIDFVKSIRVKENFKLVDIDNKIVNKSLEILEVTSLRGMDSLYVATASIYKADLVTLDKEQLAIDKRVIRAFSVVDYLTTF